MRLTNIDGYRTIDEYVTQKLADFEREEKTFETLFSYMFRESDNIMAESSDGYRVKKITYGECKAEILALAPHLALALDGVKKGSMVGLYMANSLEWIEIFWALLLCGYKPLLMNSRLNERVLESILADYGVEAVLSDGKIFSVKTLLTDELSENVRTKAMSPLQNPVWENEIVFMSSGTTEKVKLCVYTGENLFYQIADSVSIVKHCPKIAAHYHGELKQLVLLPFYHVFGFIAVYVWFGFFSRTFVFPKDLQAQTVLNTVKKHNVTHIFAVPLVWDSIYKAALKKIRLRGEKTFAKFEKALRFAEKHGKFGDWFARKAFKEIRQGLFGESVQFLISGGSFIQKETLAFFNGIGYHLTNGYGMTEIGITSVEISDNKKTLASGSIGRPFNYTQYRIGDTGELEVKGKTRAHSIWQGGIKRATDYNEWFQTRDLAHSEGGRYYVGGRHDDLIVCENGENLNPVQTEKALLVESAEAVCLFESEGQPVLLVHVKDCYSSEKLQGVYDKILENIKTANLETVVRKIHVTPDPLLEDGDFKISRKKVAKRFKNGEFRLIDWQNMQRHLDEMLSALELEVRACVAEVLDKDPATVGVDANFFRDLDGSSLDYFALNDRIQTRYGVQLSAEEEQAPSTVREICDCISKN